MLLKRSLRIVLKTGILNIKFEIYPSIKYPKILYNTKYCVKVCRANSYLLPEWKKKKVSLRSPLMCIGPRIRYSMRVLTEKREFSLTLPLSFTHFLFLSLFLCVSRLPFSPASGLRLVPSGLPYELYWILCNMPKGSPCATMNARSRARHSYAKQINSLKETNLYLPFFLSFSLFLRTFLLLERREQLSERVSYTYVVVKNQGEDDTLNYLMKKGARCTLCLTAMMVAVSGNDGSSGGGGGGDGRL